MKKSYYKTFAFILTTISVVLLIVLITLKSYGIKSNDKNSKLNKKVESEIEYLDVSIINAMNKLNNITLTRYKVYTKSINNTGVSNNDNNSDENKQSSLSNNDEAQNNAQQEEKSDKDNQNEERGNQISASKSINNNSLTETNNSNINWDEITFIYENIYSVWPTINLDLKEVGASDEYLNKFNLDLNGVAQSINSKDKNSALVNFYNLYFQLPNFLTLVTQDAYKITNYNTKVAVLNAYTLANENNKWKEISESVGRAKNNFNKMFEFVKEDDDRRNDIKKTYAIINDLENCVVLNDKNIFYMQYKNTIQSLETL